MKKILVTGGTGFIGSALVRALVQRGDKVTSFDNDSRGTWDSLKDFSKDIERVTGDIRDPVAVLKAVKGQDCVCHLAAINGTEYFYTKPHLVLEVSTKGMINVLEAVHKEGVPELVAMSSSEVYQTPPVVPTPETVPMLVPDPLNPRYSYGVGKIISEMLALHLPPESKVKSRVVRPHNVYGPRMGNEHVIPQLALRIFEKAQTAKGKIPLPIQGSGKETRAFVFIDDFIDGFLKVLDLGKHREIYHIGTEEEISISFLTHQIAKVLGFSLDLVPGPEAPGGTPRRCPDISKVSRLGYKPRVSLEEGLKRTLSWYRDYAQEKAA